MTDDRRRSWPRMQRGATSDSALGPRKLTGSLERLASDLGAPPARVLAEVFERWEDLVGPAVHAHARPVSFRDSTLLVAVDQPAWATQLRLLSAELLARFAEALGRDVVTHLEVRVRPPGRTQPEAEGSSPA